MRTLGLLAVIFIAGCGATSAPRPAVSTITLDPPPAVLLVGESLQLHAQARDASGSPLADRTITYRSTEPLVATVSEAGLVTALVPGEAGISATCEGLSAVAVIDTKLGAMVGAAGGTVSVLNGALHLTIPAGTFVSETRVYADPVDALPAGPGLLVPGTAFRLGPPNLLFTKPAMLTLRYDPALVPPVLTSSVAAYSLDGASWDAVNGSLLDSLGQTVSSPIDGTGTFALRAPGPVASLNVVPPNILVVLGTTQTLGAEPRNEGGTLLQNRSIVWSSSDTVTATVDQRGVVSGVGIGITRVSASSGGAIGSSTIIVTIICSCPPSRVDTASMGPASRTACACATGAPSLVRRRLP